MNTVNNANNYGNKAQNPAFGMALGSGMENLIRKKSVAILEKSTNADSTILKDIKYFNDHKLLIDYSPTENRSIIYSGADISMPKHIVDKNPSCEADVINLTKNDLYEYDRLDRLVQNKETVATKLDEALAESKNIDDKFLKGIKSGAFIENSKLKDDVISEKARNKDLIESLKKEKEQISEGEQKLHNFFN